MSIFEVKRGIRESEESTGAKRNIIAIYLTTVESGRRLEDGYFVDESIMGIEVFAGY